MAKPRLDHKLIFASVVSDDLMEMTEKTSVTFELVSLNLLIMEEQFNVFKSGRATWVCFWDEVEPETYQPLRLGLIKSQPYAVVGDTIRVSHKIELTFTGCEENMDNITPLKMSPPKKREPDHPYDSPGTLDF
jgi:hypothetical protein